MKEKIINYKELSKQKRQEAYAKARNKLPVEFRPSPSTQKTKARAKVHKAKKSGKLTMQPCQICGELKTEAHHPDYTKPLDVVWLCKNHHTREHYPGTEKKECIIEYPKYSEAQIIDNIANVIKSKRLLKAFIKRRTPKTEW